MIIEIFKLFLLTEKPHNYQFVTLARLLFKKLFQNNSVDSYIIPERFIESFYLLNRFAFPFFGTLYKISSRSLPVPE